MDLDSFINIIRLLLSQKGRVSIKGVGTLVISISGAKISESGHTIYPPDSKCSFISTYTDNEDLIDCLSKREKLAITIAKEEVDFFVSRILKELEQSHLFNLPGFGQFKVETTSNIITFNQEKDSKILPELYGLEPIFVKPLKKRGKIISSKYAKTSFWRVTAITAVVLATLFFGTVSVYIFKDELRPVLKVLLYSNSERKLLEEAGY